MYVSTPRLCYCGHRGWKLRNETTYAGGRCKLTPSMSVSLLNLLLETSVVQFSLFSVSVVVLYIIIIVRNIYNGEQVYEAYPLHLISIKWHNLIYIIIWQETFLVLRLLSLVFMDFGWELNFHFFLCFFEIKNHFFSLIEFSKFFFLIDNFENKNLIIFLKDFMIIVLIK